MTTTDDTIRAALHGEVPEPGPVDPTELAAALGVRVERRRRQRRRVRLLGVAGLVVVAVVAVAGVAAIDRGTEDDLVAGPGPTDGTSVAPAPEPGVGGVVLHSSGYMMAPNLDRLLTTGGAEVVVLGEVTAVGASRPTTVTIAPSGDEPPIPPITYDYAPVDIDVEQYLRIGSGTTPPDPLRLRAIQLQPMPSGGTTVPPEIRRDLGVLLPVGTRVLVFAVAPRDIGDGLMATADVIFRVTPEGVVDEAGRVISLDEVRSRLGVAQTDPLPDGIVPEDLYTGTDDLLAGVGGNVTFGPHRPDAVDPAVTRVRAEEAAVAAATASGIPADVVVAAQLGTAAIGLADGSTREVGAWLVRLRGADGDVLLLLDAGTGEAMSLYAAPPP